MNLAEALDAVPELPIQAAARRRLKLDPDLIVREQMNENGEPIAVVFAPQKGSVYRLPKAQYDLLLLFDGERTFSEIADTYTETYGIPVTEEQIKELVGASEDSGLWYRSAQEKNITLSQKLAAERRKRIHRPKKKIDVAHISFKAWDPDKYLTRLNRKLAFVFSGWFNLLALALFIFMMWVWADRFSEISRDSLLYYTFTDKSLHDLAIFWILFLFIGFAHESAHGLTAKHFGAEVHSMGLLFIYLTPAFAVDITQVWVRSEKWQRIAAMFAGIWAELLICAVATLIWWGTPPGTGAHTFAYRIMLITGIMVILMNVNPLIKLDGYYVLAEIIEIPDLKENSTAFLSGWVRKNIFGLPVDFDYVPPRRRWLYVPYAVLSGVYSYLLLFAVSRFVYNVLARFTPEWAFVPAAGVAYLIFRSRLKRLLNFMKTVYLDKRDRLRRLLSSPRGMAVTAAIALLVLLAPVWRKTADDLFVLEPHQTYAVRAQVPGLITAVMVDEGTSVQQGAPLLTMTNLGVESDAAKASADLQTSRGKRFDAQMKYLAFGDVESHFRRDEQIHQTTMKQMTDLNPVASGSGVVVTPSVRDLVGQYVREGTPLLEIADVSNVKIRLFLPEFEVRDVEIGAPVAVHFDAESRARYGRVESIAIAPSELPDGLVEKNKYAGLKPPNFYVVLVTLKNDGTLKPGMSGEAKVMIRRQSLFDSVWQNAKDFVGRRMW